MQNQHKTIQECILRFNTRSALIDELVPYVVGRDEVVIADLGAGAFSVIGRVYEDVDIIIYPSDSQNFNRFYKKHHIAPRYPIEYQNMESLTYPDKVFDLVVCLNALDHVKDAQKAVEEMIRVCKMGGNVYVDCALHQLDTGYRHFWNAHKDGVLSNRTGSFDLKAYGFQITYKPTDEDIRYHHIIATYQKYA
jgi:ubiquinone/menaquinone biosynthesis C-methylase UbiE